MSQSKFEIMNHTSPLFFDIGEDTYTFIGCVSEDGKTIIQYYSKNGEYLLTEVEGKYFLYDLESDKEIGEFGDVLIDCDWSDSLINNCLIGFNLLNTFIGCDIIEAGSPINISCNDPNYKELVLKDYWDKESH